MYDLYLIFINAFASLFSIINPIGMSPVFMTMTKNYSKTKQYQMAYKVAIYSAVLLIITFFAGPYVLKFFKISLQSIQVAGGMLVFYTAWKMLNTAPTVDKEQIKDAKDHFDDITFFPLTMPITAGPGSIAVTLALRINYIDQLGINGIIGFILAILVVACVVAVCYRFAETIFNRLGHTGISVVTTLSAFILLAIGVTIIWQGIVGMIKYHHMIV